jgi:uncharacterized protein (TIGR04255 family)
MAKLQHAPVYFALAQIRFNPVLSLETYVSDFQENLRKEGFPDFKKHVSAAFSFVAAADGAAPQLSPPQSETQYSFATMTGDAAIVLGQTHITYQVAEYDVFSTFADRLLRGLELLHQAVNLSYVERIGVRYLDAVFPRTGESIEQYLAAEVLGLSRLWSDSLAYSFTEARAQTSVGAIVSRVVIQNGGIGMPPDLNPMGVRIPDRFLKLQGRHAILDTDAFVEAREAFDLAGVRRRLFDLHREIGLLFDHVTSDHAKNVWK